MSAGVAYSSIAGACSHRILTLLRRDKYPHFPHFRVLLVTTIGLSVLVAARSASVHFSGRGCCCLRCRIALVDLTVNVRGRAELGRGGTEGVQR